MGVFVVLKLLVSFCEGLWVWLHSWVDYCGVYEVGSRERSGGLVDNISDADIFVLQSGRVALGVILG